MNPEPASTFFSVLTLFSWAAILALAGLGLAARRPGTSGGVSALVIDVRRAALPLAWVVATVTTLGSLYYSEIEHFTPCKLCWYQRIAMYPLVLLLGIAAARRDASVRLYVMAQCGVGGAIAIYHSWIQWFPPEGGTSFCTLEAPCTQRYVFELGFITLPFMALTAFVLTGALMAFLPRRVAVGPAMLASDHATDIEESR